jgi:hypothetical protein
VKRSSSPPAVLLLALLALAFGGYLLVLWRRAPEANGIMRPIGVLFVGQFFKGLVDFVIEEVAVAR